MNKITQARPDEAEGVSVGRVRRMRSRLAGGLIVGSAAAITAVSPANATPTDPTGGATATIEAGITDYITDFGSPMLFRLFLIGAAIALALYFGRKALRAIRS